MEQAFFSFEEIIMKIQVFKIILWILLFSSFFGIFSYQFSLFPILLSFVLIFRTFIFRIPGKFKRELFIYLLFFLCSSISCLIYEKQSLSVTFSSADCLLYFTIMSYYVFVSGKYKLKAMEKALAIGNIIFLSCFLLQFLAMPKQIFNLATDYLEIGRFTMMGQMITYFSLFYY